MIQGDGVGHLYLVLPLSPFGRSKNRRHVHRHTKRGSIGWGTAVVIADVVLRRRFFCRQRRIAPQCAAVGNQPAAPHKRAISSSRAFQFKNGLFTELHTGGRVGGTLTTVDIICAKQVPLSISRIYIYKVEANGKEVTKR